MLTLKQFKEFAPHTKYAEHWHDALFAPQKELNGGTLLDDYEINTPTRVAAFLAQCHHESGGFVYLCENLNYSAKGLMKTFPNHFKEMATAQQYEKKPEKIANRVYANRMGNRDEASGDGWLHAGRGIIQLTGAENYRNFAMSLEISVKEASEYMQTFEGAAQSACWFWETNGLNKFADSGDFITLSKRINGGTKGMDDRELQHARIRRILGI